MKKTTMIWIAGGSVAAVALLAWAFAPRPAEVEVARVDSGAFETTIDEDGKTRLADRYVVSAPLAGRLARITLREGDAVTADAVVATLTPVLSPMIDERTARELGARVQAAEANVQRAVTRIDRAKVAQDQAQLELKRSEQLSQQGFVAPTKLDNDRLAVTAAQKEVEAAAGDHHVATHELSVARAALSALRPQAAGARAFEVRSPVAGRVLKLHQTSEATVTLGAPLIDVGDTARLDIVAELLTTDALRATPGSRVRIERWGGPGTLEGRVRRVEPAAFTKISALGVEEQRVNVLIDIVTPHAQWAALGDGYRVSVRVVTLALPQVLRVPVSAVFPRPEGGSAVFVLDGGRAKQVPVEIGARNGTQAWIKSGVADGATVIVYPPAGLSDGARVKARSVA
ncbi:MAG: efflux RND transporter periplasmic adaptor subunit [Burkholderiaceae bacterium]